MLQSEIVLEEVDFSEKYRANCSSHPKKCFNKSICDCSKLCETFNVKKIEIKNEKCGDETFLGFEDGIYCYTPIGTDCKKGFGSWVQENQVWKCVPHYNGFFTTDGIQLLGRYPFSESVAKISKKNNKNASINYNEPNDYSVDCSNLKDEYGNPLLTFKLENNGLTFCLKDYCISDLLGNASSSHYKNGQCICKGSATNLVLGDLSSPCVEKGMSKFDTDLPKTRYKFKIGCYSKRTYTKDLDKYLLPCTDQESNNNNYLDSNEFQISTYNI